ncbi:MAG: glucose-6-phosphate isomerase [Spirochaetota bacterium]
MTMIQINTRFLKGMLSQQDVETILQQSSECAKRLEEKTGLGNDFLGWVDLPSTIKTTQLEDIQATARQIQNHSEYLVVVGIGGSYLGARAIIEANQAFFPTQGVKILYAGHHLDADYHAELLEFLQDKDFSINVISKSGTTTEPALAFRSLLKLMQKKYGSDKLAERIFSTTDAQKGALKKLSDEYNLKTFTIPDDVGGRYSVLTPVGLLPIAAAGISIDEFVTGAKAMRQTVLTQPKESNPALLYASYRNALYQSGKKIEILVNYNPRLFYLSEWWKQLYGESEGKQQKGIFPASVSFTSDLHSMGQYIQDVERILFESVLQVQQPQKDFTIEPVQGDPDGLNYIAGKTLSYVNERAGAGTGLAHYEGGVPALEIEIPKISPHSCGELVYFYEYACGVSGYLLQVNPFDQPGVEAYKKNMFALLGKKGFEQAGKEVEAKLKNLSG